MSVQEQTQSEITNDSIVDESFSDVVTAIPPPLLFTPSIEIHESVSDATAPPQGSSTALNKEFPYDPVVDWIIGSDATAHPPGSSTVLSTVVTNDSICEPVSNATAPPGSSTALNNEDTTDSIVELDTIEGFDDTIIESIIDSGTDANATPPPLLTTLIPRVPGTVREKHDYEKYFVPKAVSIGPYHFGEPKLQSVEKLKPRFTMRLLKENKETLRSIYIKLRYQVEKLRGYYEKNSTTRFCDKEFTKMMLLDSCFILYFIIFICGWGAEDYSELKSNEIFIVRRDLFLLENQIPFKVLKEVMKIMEEDWSDLINEFLDHSCFVKRKRPRRKWIIHCNGGDEDDEDTNHLLDSVHGKHTRRDKALNGNLYSFKYDGCNFRNVSELADVGIYFKPIRDTLSMTHIEFVKSWSGLSAYVKLPPIAMSDYTRPMLLNLMAYETCLRSITDSWVTSYVYLLGYLIDDVEDVKLLRKAWVLENYLASDKEVVDLFDEIGTDLVENSYEYLEAKYKIQRHYESRRNKLFSQLKNEYFKSPWVFFALLGALIALFLTGVQTYYTVWSPKSICDDLCMYLKMNHHL